MSSGSYSLDRMIRPKLVYLSSDDSEIYSNNGKIDLFLKEHIYPEDGHHLMYGVRSIGYNSTVRNISETNGNNEIHLELFYQTTPASILAPQYFDPITGTWHAKTGIPVVKQLVIKVPSAAYTLDSLFDFLSNKDDENPNYFIPTGFYEYFLDAPVARRKNEMLARLVFKQTPSGFQIFVRIDNQAIIDDRIEYPPGSSAFIDIVEATLFLTSIRIIPSSRERSLYNQLFTNVRNYEVPSCVPSYHRQSGMNPPHAIQFNFANITVGTSPYDKTDFTVVEIGNEALFDTANNHFPDMNRSHFRNIWESFYTPKLNPIYVDIETSLPVSTYTREGVAKNLLSRSFVLGGEDGNNSYFHYFDVPVMYSLEGHDRLTEISLHFSSESELWDFFDLEFLLELVIYEVEDEKMDSSFVDPNLDMPESDPLTTAVNSYSNQAGQHLPLTSSGMSGGYINFKRRRL